MSTQTPQSLAAEIRRLRQQRAWSQQQLAAASGLSERTVQRVERSKSCAPDTLQALAAALAVDIADLARLAPAQETGVKWLGLSTRQSLMLGLVLCLPALAFVLTNVAAYEFRAGELQPLIASTFWNAIAASPLTPAIVLGGPLIALLITAPHAIRLNSRRNGPDIVFDAIALRANAGHWLVLALATALLAVLAIYLSMENLGHLINGA